MAMRERGENFFFVHLQEEVHLVHPLHGVLLNTGPTRDLMLVIDSFMPELNPFSELKAFFYLSPWSLLRMGYVAGGDAF